MIKYTYTRKENLYRIEIESPTFLKPEDFPLVVTFYKTVNREEGWRTELNENSWATWKGGDTPFDFEVCTQNGTLIAEHRYDAARDGDKIERTLWHFVKSINEIEERPANGLVIGSHDGAFGHWVFPVIAGMSNAILVDGSFEQLDAATKNYEPYQALVDIEFMHNIITPDGKPVQWYTGGEGYTDTVVKSVINEFLSDDLQKVESRESLSVSDMLSYLNIVDGDIDWLHLDVEGIDADLAMALPIEPALIILETSHVKKSNQKYMQLLDWFSKRGYRFQDDGENGIAIKIGK